MRLLLATVETKIAMSDITSQLLGQIHDFVTDPGAADGALELMANKIDADKAVLVRLASDRRRDMTLGSYGLDRDLIAHLLRERKNPDFILSREARWTSGRQTSGAIEGMPKQTAQVTSSESTTVGSAVTSGISGSAGNPPGASTRTQLGGG